MTGQGPTSSKPTRRISRRLSASLVLAVLLVTGLVIGSQVGDQQPLVGPTGQSGRSLFVAVNGVASNPGSFERPLDLVTAIGPQSPAKPGDTIWLRGGTYAGSFTSHLTGAVSAPIVVRQVPGERATIDGVGAPTRTTLTIRGADAWYVGFEVANSHPNRIEPAPGQPTTRGTTVEVFGARTKVINLVVHDGLNGIGFWTPAVEAEVYGTLSYNNGVEGPDRGHGHGLYVQNQTGVKRMVDNIVFNSFAAGIHAYTEQGFIDNLYFEGNLSFNNGTISRMGGSHWNFLIGGNRPSQNPVLRENFTYYPPQTEGTGVEMGYGVGCRNARLTDNYFAGDFPLSIDRCQNVVLTSNTLYGRIPSSLSTNHPGNTYLRSRPTETQVFVRPNIYEHGRAHIIVFNWGDQEEVEVSTSGLRLGVGDRFEVRDAQNYFGPPVAAGIHVWGRPIVIPLTRLVPAPPVGNAPLAPTHTAPEFTTFILVPVSSRLPGAGGR
jgi:hypothetical protein